ncbi:MAG: P-loop NTPase [Proteobacteria bacterium]|nr:P-loop NTPase [Pseudomonadota bacterium]
MTAPLHISGTQITAIGSGKGGTGKTLVAVSLAHAFAHEGERILLLDADLGLSNTTVHLGLESGGNLFALLAGKCPLADAVVKVQGGIDIRGGFDLLSGPSGSGALANIDRRIATMLMKGLRGANRYDRIVVDLGAGVDATTMDFAVAADETILVLTPDPAALTDAYAFAKLLLRATGSRMPHVVVNMAASGGEAHRTADALSSTCRSFLKKVPEYLGSIPRDNRVMQAIRQQAQMLTMFPQAPASRAVEQIARKLHSRMAPPHAAAHTSQMR